MDGNNSNVITIHGEDGVAKQYTRLSARIPDFLKKFPPDEKYRVETKMADLLSMQPARLSLVREAIAIGKRPEEMGLSIETDITVMICTCSLYGPNGDLISNRHASKQILDYKDLEVLETAAFQRLIASLGFGGEIFDEDENSDITTMGNTVDTEKKQENPATSGDLASKPVEAVATSQPTSSKASKPEPVPTTELVVATESLEDEPANDDVPPALRRQVENLAQSLDVDVPSMTTLADAQTAMMDLNKQVRDLRQAS